MIYRNTDRTCKTCELAKPIDRFKSPSLCLECFTIENRKRTAKYYAQNREARMATMRAKYAVHKELVFNHYGAKCACCGESEPLFLAIDHVENDGHLHRKKNGKSTHNNIYGWLVRNGFPLGFQTLCMNCNHGKHRNGGVCPHMSRTFNDQSKSS